MPRIQLTNNELAAVLGGLRLLQVAAEKGSLMEGIRDIYEQDGDGLSVEEIGSLCERLNQ